MAAHEASSFGWSYEVFLSFHGDDVRKNFADCLYFALRDAGILTFRDEDELLKGKEIGPELCAAIPQSRISIPILSENYASSKWCLNELTQICKCRRTKDQIVLPIFYKVEPRDVRNQKRKYGEAFEEHHMGCSETTVQEWREALKEVGALDGWPLTEDTYQGQLIKKIVTEVFCILNKGPFVVPDDLVGIQSHIEKMLMLLDIESNNKKIVGIHGLSGIGKTTIARVVYNKIIHKFEGHMFVEDIHEKVKKDGLPHLQGQLISGILKQENLNITSVADGINEIKKRFCQKKVLIVFDDVDQEIQAESLIGDHGWFGIGSKIIITSRNKNTLKKTDETYHPDVMDLEDSLKLFSYHAFGRDQPPEDYFNLSKDMVETTRRLPLAVKVIGSSLYLEEKSFWKDMLAKLQKVPDDDVINRLKITSYDGLRHEEQQMFLDTACFFIGTNKDFACHIWEACGFFPKVRLGALGARSLVTINEEGELTMHDLLRDLGRQIVREENIHEPGKRSRIWSQEDVLEVLGSKAETWNNVENLSKKNENVKGLSIEFEHISTNQCLMSAEFATMTSLRFLRVHSASFSGKLMHSFSELRWLSWEGCSDQFVQIDFCAWKLAVLDLSCIEITNNWKGWRHIKMARKLKVLRLESCNQLSRTPTLSENRDLEVLILEMCRNLVEIDTSIGDLKRLVILDMSRCVNLVDLPVEIGQLTSLQTLDLRGCYKLKRLPIGICGLISLKVLNLSCCENLVDLPTEICQLTSLQSLDLLGCSGLKKLPEKLGSMISLIELDLSWQGHLVDLAIANEICQLTSLKILRLRECRSLRELPKELSCMISLTTLEIIGCEWIESLPNLLSLKNLQNLNLSDCKKLLHIPNLPSSLTHLDVGNCSSIRYMPCLPSSLAHLNASGCQSMKKLSSRSGLRNLETLSLDHCNSLGEIEGVDDEGLSSLERFTMSSCLIKKLPKLTGSKKLEYLEIHGCGECSGDICVPACSEVSDIEGRGMDSLRELKIKYFPSLRKLSDLSDSKQLERLIIAGATSLEILPDLSNFERLCDLQITYCKKLTKIHGVDSLEFLVNLDINGCESLEELLDLSNLRHLEELTAMDCRNLTKIQADNGLPSLIHLDIRGCISIEKIPDLTILENFTTLNGRCCWNPTNTTDVYQFNVQLLTDGGFPKLQLHPDLSNLTRKFSHQPQYQGNSLYWYRSLLQGEIFRVLQQWT